MSYPVGSHAHITIIAADSSVTSSKDVIRSRQQCLDMVTLGDGEVKRILVAYIDYGNAIKIITFTSTKWGTVENSAWTYGDGSEMVVMRQY